MTEEMIIFEQDGNIVGITKEGKYFESYKTTRNVAILRGAGLYIKRLEQENKELKETVKDLNQSIQNCNIQRTKMYKALEEIRTLCFKDVGDYLNAKVVWLIDEVLNEVDR